MTEETIKRLNELYAIDTSGLGTEKATGAAWVIELNNTMEVRDAKENGTFMNLTEGVQYLVSLKERLGLWIPENVNDKESLGEYIESFQSQIVWEFF